MIRQNLIYFNVITFKTIKENRLWLTLNETILRIEFLPEFPVHKSKQNDPNLETAVS